MRFTFLALLLLVFPITLPAEETVAVARVAPPPHRQWVFEKEGVTFDTQFPGARLNECTARGSDEFEVVIRPENAPINDSPWYAFQVSAREPREIAVTMRVEHGKMRYQPKISTDGKNWVPLPAASYQHGDEKAGATMKLEVGPEPLWVAGQEVVSRERLEAWCDTLERLPHVTRTTFAGSVRGTPLQRLEIGAGAKDYVAIISRQHPPESTGSLALMAFVETIAGDTALAREFRQQFTAEVMPLLNPDGVDDGHWRHNLGGVDLNRDWGTFSQPETVAASGQVQALAKEGRLWLFLDFHSTMHDVFYTQADAEPTVPAGFTKEWLGAIQQRFPDYKVDRSASRIAGVPGGTRVSPGGTSIGWAHRTFGVPAITYEIGDETDRALLRQIATAAAEEMMKRLLVLKKG